MSESKDSAFGHLIDGLCKNKYREHQEIFSKVASAYDREDAILFLKLLPRSPMELLSPIIKDLKAEFPFEKLDFYDGIHLERSLNAFAEKYEKAFKGVQKEFVDNTFTGLKNEPPEELLKVLAELAKRLRD